MTMAYLDAHYDPPAICELLENVHGEVAFDIGANGGFLADIFAQHFAHVHAFEPCQESYEHLAVSHAPNVVAHLVAISDLDGTVDLLEATVTDTMGELVTGESLPFAWGPTSGRRQVAAMTLDTAAEQYGIPDFVKIDTEGHEVPVIRGGLRTLLAHMPTLLIEVHAQANGPAILDLLPFYRWQRIDHPAYGPGSYGQNNHFYLVGKTA